MSALRNNARLMLVAAIPPERVPVIGGFDYVTVDARRRRVYAAHTGSRALLIVDADTGDGEADTVSEVDPIAMTVLRTASVAGRVDAIAYDAGNGHIYADEDDGTRVFVVDARTMSSIGTVSLPGHKPEYLSVDPVSHDVYQNIADLSEFVVIDGTTLAVEKIVATPGIANDHPLQFDRAYRHVLVGGLNGTLAAYDASGKLLGTVAIQSRVDQCDLDQTSHELACAGAGMLTVVRDEPSGAPTLVSQTAVSMGAHTVAIDPQRSNAWIVWSGGDGDFVSAFALR